MAASMEDLIELFADAKESIYNLVYDVVVGYAHGDIPFDTAIHALTLGRQMQHRAKFDWEAYIGYRFGEDVEEHESDLKLFLAEINGSIKRPPPSVIRKP